VKIPTFAAVLFLMVGIASGCTAGEIQRKPRLYDVDQGREASVAAILPQLQDVRVVLVGEQHSTASHHRAQLEIVRLLREPGKPVAVGLEMFRHDSQDALDRWIGRDLSEDAFREVFRDNWGFGWDLYRDIFVFARGNGLPMVGLNVPRDVTRQVARKGYRSLGEDQRAKLGDVSCRVDEAYMAFIRRAYGAHGYGDEEGFLYFCEAQMVWDSAMAVHALRYLEDNPTRTMVMLTGTAHARKQAIPAQLRSRSDVPVAVVLPEVPGSIDRDTIGMDDADYLFLDLDER
jgi:uncharacterized iron-regulated protein